jgi:hypothetical protein
MKNILRVLQRRRICLRGVSRLGSALMQLVLDRIYGPPQLQSGQSGTPRPGAGQAVPPRAATDNSDPGASCVPESDIPALPVAARVRTAKLVGPHGIVYGDMCLYLYPARGIARRMVKVTDQHLAKALRKKRFHFSDVPFDPVAGCKPLFDALHGECKRLLNVREDGRARKQKERMDMAVAAPRKAGHRADGTTSEPAQVAAALQAPTSVSAATVGPRPAGQTHQGVVASAGRTRRTAADGSSYSTFCLTLNDGVREIPLFGNELERQAADQRIRPGERVQVVFMGKAAAGASATGTAFRNLYQLTRMEAP